LYLHIEVLESDSFDDLLNRVTEEYIQAFEHADSGYMEAQVPRPDFTRTAAFNWIPQGSKSDPSDVDRSEDAITCSPVPFQHPMLKSLEVDNEPTILLFDSDDEIRGEVNFPLDRVSIASMESFGRNFLLFIRALLRQPQERVKDIALLQ